MTTPALPPGFELDAAPPSLPPGFELDTATPAAPPQPKSTLGNPLPPTTPGADITPTGPTQSNWGEDIKGAVQAALHVATGLTNFLPGLWSGVLKGGATGLAESLARTNVERERRSRGVSETLPTDPWAPGERDPRAGEKIIAEEIGRATYMPTSKVGQELVENYVAPVMEAGVPLMGIGHSMATDAASARGQRIKARTAEAVSPLSVRDMASAVVPAVRTSAEVAAETAKARKLAGPEDQGIVDAIEAGFKVTPKAGRGGKPSRMAQTAAGSARLEQELSAHNSENAARLAREDIGVAPDEPLTRDLTERVRKEAGEAYAVLDDVGRVDLDKQFAADVSRVAQPFVEGGKDFPQLARNAIIQAAQDLKVDSAEVRSVLEVVKDLRNKSDIAFRSGDKQLGNSYRALAQAADNAIDRAIDRAPAGTVPENAVQAYRAARVRIAKSYMVDEAMNAKPGEVDLNVYRKALEKGVRLDGAGLQIAKFAKQFGDEGLTRRMGKSGAIGPSYFDLLFAGLRGNLAEAVLTVGSRPGTRAFLGSKYMQERLRKRAKGQLPGEEPPPPPPPEPTTSPGAGGPYGGEPPPPGPLGDLTPDWETGPGAGGGGGPPGIDPTGLVRALDEGEPLPQGIPERPGAQIPLAENRPLGDLTPDWETEPGAGPPPAGGAPLPAEGLHPAVGEPPPTTGSRGVPGTRLEIPAVPGRPDLPDTLVSGAPAETAATERANRAMGEPGAIEARRQQGKSGPGEPEGEGGVPTVPETPPRRPTGPSAAETERLLAENPPDAVKKVLQAHLKALKTEQEREVAAQQREADVRALERAAGETTDKDLKARLLAQADKLREPIPVGEVIEGQPEIKAEVPKSIPKGRVIEGQPKIEPEKVKEKIPVGEATEITPELIEAERAWRTDFKLGEEDAARARRVAQALGHDAPAVERAAVQHEHNPRAFDREIERINAEARIAAEEARARRIEEEHPKPASDDTVVAPQPEKVIPVEPTVTDLPGFEPGDTLERFGPKDFKGNSWVLREKATGEAVAETRDPAKVRALNTEKYEAVPVGQHLVELNKRIKAAEPPPPPPPPPPPKIVSPEVGTNREKMAHHLKAAAPQPEKVIPVEPTNQAKVMVPPVVREMIGAAQTSVEALRGRISNVKWGDAEKNEITFDFDGKPHIGKLRGRNADLLLSGKSTEADRAVALRVLLDSDARPKPDEPPPPPPPPPPPKIVSPEVGTNREKMAHHLKASQIAGRKEGPEAKEASRQHHALAMKFQEAALAEEKARKTKEKRAATIAGKKTLLGEPRANESKPAAQSSESAPKSDTPAAARAEPEPARPNGNGAPVEGGEQAPAGRSTPVGEVAHIEPGKPPTPVTEPIIAETVRKAAGKTTLKPSEIKAKLLAAIDEAIPRAKDADDADVHEYTQRSRTRVDQKALDRRGLTGGAREAEEKRIQHLIDSNRNKAAINVGYAIFDIPGDGQFKVLNTRERLAEFRKQVETSPGFKDKQPKPFVPRAVEGPNSPANAIKDMIDDGDPQAAVDYAAAKGVKLGEVLAGDKKRLERVKGLEPTPAPEPGEMFSSGNPDIFYSPLTRAIEGLKQGKGTPGDWANILKGLTTKGVKADEIEWSGVNDWLKAQGKQVTREQVLGFLREGGVKVEEVQKGGESAAGGVPLFKGSPSTGAKPVGSPEALDTLLREKFGSKLIEGLHEQGILKYALARDEGQTGAKSGTKAVFRQRPGERPTATLYFDRLTPEQAPAALLHELGEHFGIVRVLGTERYNVMLNELRGLRDTPEVAEAWKHVERNYVGENTAAKLKSTDDPIFIREVAAKLVEDHPDLPFVRRLINEIRAFLYEHFGTTLGNRVDANLIRGMAASALRKAAKGELPATPPVKTFRPLVRTSRAEPRAQP